jgi:hypothetical protein
MFSQRILFLCVWLLIPGISSAGSVDLTPSDSTGPGHKYSFQYGFERPYFESVPFNVRSWRRQQQLPLVTGSVGMQGGRLINYEEESANYSTRTRISAAAMFTVRLYRELVVQGTLFQHIGNRDKPLPFWVSDAFYSVKWTNWRPYTFSMGYDNYADNRYSESLSQWGKKFLQGFFFVSFNARLPKPWIEKMRLDEHTDFTLVPALRYFPQFRDMEGTIYHHRIIGALTARYTIWKRFYIEGGAYYYPEANTRMPWDPDFTYGFGYFDYRPWKLSVTYGNWIANRFTGSPGIPMYGFTDGNFSVMFNYGF